MDCLATLVAAQRQQAAAPKLRRLRGSPHERDVLSIPPNIGWHSFTLDNYLTFLHASGIAAIVGSRAAENTLPGILNSLIAATATAVLNLLLGTLAG